MLRNEKVRIAYASMEPTKKDELLAKQRSRRLQLRESKSLRHLGLDNTTRLVAGTDGLMFDAACFALRLSSLLLLVIGHYNIEMHIK